MFQWTVTREDGGKDRAGQAVVAVGHQVFSFTDSRSYSSKDHVDVNVFHTVSLRWRTPLPPVTTGIIGTQRHKRYSHTAVLIDHVVYIFGGVTTWREDVSREYCDVLYAFDVDTHRWFLPEISGAVPSPRYLHSACVLGKVMFIYGGQTQTVFINDMYKLDTTTMVWALINTKGTPPPASTHHSATIIGTKMFVFGGWNLDQSYNTIRVFDTETNQWMNTPSAQLLPEGRCDHSAFTYNGELYIFGGQKYNQTFNDLWKFNPETFSWRKVEIKGRQTLFRGKCRMCCCMVGDRIFIFGGYGDDGGSTPDLLNDLHILDMSPSLKTLCKLAVIQYDLEQSELTHDVRWELAAMTTNSNT